MNIQQLSVFLENKSGTLLQVFNLLKQAGISLVASNIADTVDYGICRIICCESERAYQVLREAGVAVTLTDVFAISLDNTVGQAADAISLLSSKGINIPYLYSFLLGGNGVLIFRTDNAELAKKVINESNLNQITEADLKEMV